MIIICPGCYRRYRHDFQAAAARVAHCAACDERFEPVPAKRTYVLVPGGAVPESGMSPAAIGMDDPLLAGKPLGAGALYSSPGLEPVEATETVPAEVESDGEKRIAPHMTAVLEASVAVVPCGLGAGLAYYFAGSLNQDPIISAILGGVTGLLLGWACMLWIAHAD